MARRSVAAMSKAREVVDRLLGQGVSVEQTARKSGVTVMTVNRWREAGNSHNITNTGGPANGSLTVPHNISWSEALDTAWETRRRIGGIGRYRALLQRFAGAFAELADPMPDAHGRVTVAAVTGTACGVCLWDDLQRAPCPGHVVRSRA